MMEYHDKEWGVPVKRDKKHFEFLILESAQAGLSWLTILKRRDGYRKAFVDYDIEKIAKFTEKKKLSLMQDSGIIRNRMKIDAAVNNAQAFLEIQKEFGTFNKFIWQYMDGKPIVNKFKKESELPAKTPESEALFKELKKRGFKFLGPTTVYAHMQAAGLVNDHTIDCFRYKEVQKK